MNSAKWTIRHAVARCRLGGWMGPHRRTRASASCFSPRPRRCHRRTGPPDRDQIPAEFFKALALKRLPGAAVGCRSWQRELGLSIGQLNLFRVKQLRRVRLKCWPPMKPRRRRRSSTTAGFTCRACLKVALIAHDGPLLSDVNQTHPSRVNRLRVLTLEQSSGLAYFRSGHHAFGSRTTNRAPTTWPVPSRRFSALMRPFRASTIWRLIDRPKPECWPKRSPCGRSE